MITVNHYTSKDRFVNTYRLICRLVLAGSVLLIPIWGGVDPYPSIEIAKVFFFEISAVVFISLFLLGILNSQHEVDWLKGLKTLSPIVFVGGAVVFSAIFGINPASSWWGSPFRQDGVFVQFLLWTVAGSLTFSLDRRFLQSIARAAQGSAILIALSICFQAFVFHRVGLTDIAQWGSSFGSLFNQPVYAAGFLLVSAPLGSLVYLRHQKLSRRIIVKFVSYQALILSALIITQTWVAVGIYLCSIGLFWGRNWGKQIGIGILAVTGGAVFQLAPIMWQSSLVEADSRIRFWITLLMASQERPVFGWGWGQVATVFSMFHWPFYRTNDIYLDKAHSHFLEYLVTTGIVGLIAYLYAISKVLLVFWRLYSRVDTHKMNSFNLTHLQFFQLMASFISYVVFTQTNITSIATELLFWLLIGIGLHFTLNLKTNSPHPPTD